MADSSYRNYNSYSPLLNYSNNKPSFCGSSSNVKHAMSLQNYKVRNYSSQPDSISFCSKKQKTVAKSKKEGLSTGIKVAIGAAVLTLLAIGADFLFCQGKHVKNLWNMLKGNKSKPAVKSEVKSVVKADVKPLVKSEVKPVVKADVSPVVKSEVKSVVKADVNPVVKSEVKSVVKADVKPVVSHEVKPEIKTDVEPIVKPVIKPAVNPKVKAEVNTEFQLNKTANEIVDSFDEKQIAEFKDFLKKSETIEYNNEIIRHATTPENAELIKADGYKLLHGARNNGSNNYGGMDVEALSIADFGNRYGNTKLEYNFTGKALKLTNEMSDEFFQLVRNSGDGLVGFKSIEAAMNNPQLCLGDIPNAVMRNLLRKLGYDAIAVAPKGETVFLTILDPNNTQGLKFIKTFSV